MSKSMPILETPIQSAKPTKAVQDEREDEPEFDVDQIQGNIFPGFDKDFQTLLFLSISDARAFAHWLRGFVRHVATMGQVVQFNRLYKEIRTHQKSESKVPKITWVNVAFSFAGLKKMNAPGVDLTEFVDDAFREGLLKRSTDGALGDPVGTGKAGDPVNWLVGGPGREPDVVLLLAGDDRDDLDKEVARLVSTVFPSSDAQGQRVDSGASFLYRQDGATLSSSLKGHEHFGFRDGISQPGIRGKLPDGTFLTAAQNPLNVNQGKPGQDLLWPGEFVFGYPGQDGNKDVADPGEDPLTSEARKAPEFARNGSFLVFRRLRQHVGMFHQFLQSVAAQFQVTPELAGAKMVGRWPSGAPAVVTPTQDDLDLAHNDCKSNNFEYGSADADDAPEQRPPAEGDCPNVTEPPNDPDGSKVPFAGHIRKTYPRNDTSPEIPPLNESTTQTHRLLRRGIPFGAQSVSTPHQPVVDDDIDRGLLFLAYQVSIVDQFEFVTANWVNNASFKQGGAGHDPIIGQNASDPSRRRSFRLNLPGETQPIETDQEWVVPTGGGYFFAPSIKALHQLAGETEAGTPPAKKTKPHRKSSRKTRK